VGEDTINVGRLQILKARMNQDLHMADHLKKTGAANLFVVFGEPDIRIEDAGDGRIQVRIEGVDIFDPNTGTVKSSSTDDIACWFLDTDYDDESFFVRHAYFMNGGTKDPYEKLKRSLKAEIDEEAWQSLHSNVSRPFPKPDTGRIAVKVINHLGDEVLEVYDVE
jgi:adenine-specific DNA-methyltransferase